MQRVVVYGAGAFGTALAIAARRAGREVALLARDAAAAAAIAQAGENRAYLPGIRIDKAIRVTGDAAVLAAAEIVILATPAQSVRAAAAALAPRIQPRTPVVLATKGIEQATGLLAGEVLAESLPQARVAMLSGPSFAHEIGQGLPTAVTVAAGAEALALALVQALGSVSFRPYASTDLIGVELGGVVKNVIAIACGIALGRGFGENARAALMTRGLAEMARLGHALGADARTFIGLAGIGDLALTATSTASRNYSLGLALGRGKSFSEATGGGKVLAEGAFTAPALLARAKREGVEMPIAAAVDAVLHRGAAVDATIKELLARPFRAEQAAY
ncbi:MAG: NAD(P)-dependent glycerol-3-phosphate dehydrogenase [Alphaproteobacteria bacterium]|nr:NAD(P)-dependent glycerol-3-phosphate dehydrogenase [Alphaproteobacteria bacterium]